MAKAPYRTFRRQVLYVRCTGRTEIQLSWLAVNADFSQEIRNGTGRIQKKKINFF